VAGAVIEAASMVLQRTSAGRELTEIFKHDQGSADQTKEVFAKMFASLDLLCLRF